MNLLLFALLLLAAGAVWSLLVCRRPRLALAGALLAVLAAACLAVYVAGATLAGATWASALLRWPTPLGYVELGVALDGVAAWFTLTTGLLSAAVAVYSWGYMQDELHPGSIAAYGSLLCLLVASLLVVFSAADAALFLSAWEVMALAGFFLVMFHDREGDSRRGAWIYLIALHIGTAVFLLPLFAVVVARSGSLQFSTFAVALAGLTPGAAAGLFILGLIGFATKSGLMPMHVWLPHAHPAAPSPVSALLSGVVIKSGIYGLLRLLSWLPPLPLWCGIVLLLLAVVSGVMGVLYALGQHHMKRLLAYSSVENIGIMGIAIGIGMIGQASHLPALVLLGYAGALLHVLNHALFKGLLFLSAGAAIHSAGTGDIDQLGGLAKKTPLNALMFLLAGLSICGLPPFNGFVSEWLIYNALFQGALAQQPWAWAAVLGLTALALIGGLALACFANVFGVVFLGEARQPDRTVHPTPLAMRLGMVPLALACLLIGCSAGALPPVLHRVIGALLPGAALDGGQVAAILRPLSAILPVLGVLLGVIMLLLLVRRRSPATKLTVFGRPTWGCGFAYPNPRVQYTGSSFAWSLIESFSELLLPHRQVERPVGYFPAPGRLQSQIPDLAETRAYSPLFTMLARAFQRLWPLQHGRIQLYLIYIVAALLIVFAVEVIWTPLRRPSQPLPGHSHSVSVLQAPQAAREVLVP